MTRRSMSWGGGEGRPSEGRNRTRLGITHNFIRHSGYDIPNIPTEITEHISEKRNEVSATTLRIAPRLSLSNRRNPIQ